MPDADTRTDGTEHPEEVQQAWDRITADADRDVWVVERNPGSGWRVSAVLASYDEAEQYRDDLRTAMEHYPEDFPERFKTDYDIRIRHGSRKSGTKMFEEYPPRSLDTGTEHDHD